MLHKTSKPNKENYIIDFSIHINKIIFDFKFLENKKINFRILTFPKNPQNVQICRAVYQTSLNVRMNNNSIVFGP